MTYCIGWRTPSGVLLAADSAATIIGEAQDSARGALDRTSFGELQGMVDGRSGKRRVVEETLKVRVIGDSVAAMTGDLRTALNLLATIELAISCGSGHRAALASALTSNQPFSPEHSTSVLYAFYEDGVPRLALLDTDDGGSISDVEGLVQLGSVGDDHVRYTGQMIRGLAKVLGPNIRPPAVVATIFSQVLALAQSYGVHDYLLRDGIGGAFTGAWVTAEGAFWQKSILYVIHPPQPTTESLVICAVSSRDGTTCLINNSTGASIGITGSRYGETAQAERDRAARAVTNACEDFDAVRFDYIVFINTGAHIVSMLEMRRNRHHQYLYLDSYEDDNGERKVGIVWSEALVELVNKIETPHEIVGDELTLKYLPYQPADAEEIRQLEAILPLLREGRLPE